MKELALIAAILVLILPVLLGGSMLPFEAVLVGWAACAAIAVLDWAFPSGKN